MMLAFAIDPFAQAWMTAIERACWQGGAALLVAWIICRCWRSMPGRAQCWVWRLAYAKLLLALVWSAPLNLHLLPAIQQQPVATKQVTAAVPQTVSFANPDVRPSAPSVIPPAGHSIDWPTVLLATWASGVAIALAVNIGRMVSTIRMRRKCVPIDDPDILGICEKVAAKLGIKTIPPLLQSHSASSPMLVGPFRSAIVLPASALEQRRSRLELMLAHELAHHRRHDLLWNWPVALADLLLFFHPLVWLARRESRLAQELDSDQLVLEMTQNAASEYAQTLLSIALRKHIARPPAYAVGALTSRKSLHRRIVAMSRISNWSSARWTVAGAIVIALALLIIPPWRVVAADKESSASPTTSPSQPHPPAEIRLDGHPYRPHMGGTSNRGPEFTGYIKSATITLRPPVAGNLEKVDVQDGQRVKRGQVLFEMDSRREQADLRVSEAQIQLAQSQLRRARALVAQKSISQEELETMTANVEIAEANLQVKKLSLEQLRITAPFDGVVHTSAIAGQQVAGTDSLGDLIQVDVMDGIFDLRQSLARKIKVGQEVRMWTPGNDQPIKAQVSSIASVVAPSTDTIQVRCRVVEKTDRLMPGMRVTVSFEPAAAGDEKPELRKH